jgi:hypothetical protein
MSNPGTDFEIEFRSLALACAGAKLRLDEGAPQAFKAAYLSFRGRKTRLGYFERKWLSLRLNAVKRGMVLDPQVDAGFLKEITPAFCPVTMDAFAMASKSSDTKSPNNPSVDRLVNEGVYAAGNICMLSIRANTAKGSKTFEDVAALASTGVPKEGLESVEWARLASLMYGAWSVAVRGADPYLLPLATYPAPRTFTSESQVVQLMLMRHCRDEVWPDSMYVWLNATVEAGGSPDRFMDFAQQLRTAVAEEEYAPTAWLHPGVFDGFEAWYNACKSTISPLLQSFRTKYQAGIDSNAIASRWRVGKRYVA